MPRTPRRRPRQLLDALESRILLTAYNPYAVDYKLMGLNFAVHRPSNAKIYVDTNLDGGSDRTLTFGQNGDTMVVGDLNGDGLTDPGVFRDGFWLFDINRDSVADVSYNFGQAGDIPLLGDTNNDGYGDLILYRNGTWLVSQQRDGNTSISTPFGAATDVPVVGDLNGDGRLDRGVYRPSTGVWYFDSAFSGVLLRSYTFGGQAGDLPFIADFNADQFGDLGIFRNGTIIVDVTRTGNASFSFAYGGAGDKPVMGRYSTATTPNTVPVGLGLYDPAGGALHLDPRQNLAVSQTRFLGLPGDKLVVGDFDGNTVTDTAVVRGNTWHFDLDHNGPAESSVSFGLSTDTFTAGDVNNDGTADLVAFRNGQWLVDTDRNGTTDSTSTFGQAGDIPILADFNGDGITDRAVVRSGTWIFDYNYDTTSNGSLPFGSSTDIPFAADFNYDGKADIGVYRNGVWYIDAGHAGSATLIFSFGSSAHTPVAGSFDSSRSVFVKAGVAGGNGTEASPFSNISAAAANAAPGAIIRIAKGTYVEQVTLNSRGNLTFLGAGRNATTIVPTAGNGFTLNTSANIHIHNLAVRSQDTNILFGRGIQSYGSTVFVRGVKADGSYNENVYSAIPPGGFSLVQIRDSSMNDGQTSAALFVEGGTILRLSNITVNNTGTSPTKRIQWGRALVISGNNNTAVINGATVTNNNDHGFIADGTADVLLRASTFSNHPNANGAIIAQHVNFLIEGSTFENSGTIGDPSKPFNGLEIDNTGTNERGFIINSTFRNNASLGVFLGAGTYFYLQGNRFENNRLAQLIVNGVDQTQPPWNELYVKGNATAYIYGNTFFVDPSLDVPGLTAVGPGATAYVGGPAAWQKNTFTNFPDYSAIFVDRHPINLQKATVYALPQSSNTFVNSPNPIGGYGASNIP